MLVLIASDIHGRLNATKFLLHAVKRYEPDKIILLGDYLYNGPRNGVPGDYDGLAVSQYLNTIADRVVGVRGNCDARIDQDLLRFPIEDRQEVDFCGRHCVLIHGDNLDPSFVNAKPGDVVMSGHTHLPVLEEKDGIVYLNPGSTSFPKGTKPASFALMNDNGIVIQELVSFKEMARLLFPR